MSYKNPRSMPRRSDRLRMRMYRQGGDWSNATQAKFYAACIRHAAYSDCTHFIQPVVAGRLITKQMRSDWEGIRRKDPKLLKYFQDEKMFTEVMNPDGSLKSTEEVARVRH